MCLFRTETTAYPPSFDLISALEEQADHPSWGRVVTYLLNSGRVAPAQVYKFPFRHCLMVTRLLREGKMLVTIHPSLP